jgi:cyclohexa-1,5-dienecarbonyl-CoA hydratase
VTQTQEKKIRVASSEGGQLHVVLDAGKGNILDRAAIAQLRAILAEWHSDAHRRCLLLDHAGEHFSFGASVSEHVHGEVEQMLPELHGLARELLELDVPVLACVRGLCLGGGLELALLADRLFASPTARFGQPEVELAVFAPIASALLPRIVGPRAAADLLITGRQFGVEEGVSLGLVSAVAEDPGAAAREWAAKHLANKSAVALRYATRAARQTWMPEFLGSLALLERVYLDELMATHDAREGIAAFIEKRRPTWEDR